MTFKLDDDELSKDGSQPPSKKAKKGKKSISWANEENLIKVCYFELDEEERGGFTFYLLFDYIVLKFLTYCPLIPPTSLVFTNY